MADKTDMCQTLMTLDKFASFITNALSTTVDPISRTKPSRVTLLDQYDHTVGMGITFRLAMYVFHKARFHVLHIMYRAVQTVNEDKQMTTGHHQNKRANFYCSGLNSFLHLSWASTLHDDAKQTKPNPAALVI
eukprot:992728_1